MALNTHTHTSSTSMSVHLQHAPRVAHLDDEMDVDGMEEDVDAETEDEEEEEDADEEVDQLDSDTEDDAAAKPAPSASAPRARQRRNMQRVVGQPAIPLDRIETILDADGMGSYMSREALFTLAAATEDFVKRLAEAGHRQAAMERRATINYRDVASATLQNAQFKFLQDTIPEPLSLSAALELRALKEKELLEPPPPSAPPTAAPSPLPSFTPLPTPMTSAAPSISSTSRGQSNATGAGRGRGKFRVNVPVVSSVDGGGRSEGTVARRQSAREPKPRRRGDEVHGASVSSASIGGGGSGVGEEIQNAKPNGTRRTSRGSRSRGTEDSTSTPASASARSRGVNGSAHHISTSARSAGHSAERDYVIINNTDERWTSTSASPGLMPIGGPGVPFVRNGLGLSENPGRTIYSQQRQPNR